MACKTAASTKYTKYTALDATYHHAVDGDVVSDVWRCKLREWKTAVSKDASCTFEISASAKMLSYAYEIPNELRSEIWFYASGAHTLMRKHTDRMNKNHATNYHNLSQMENTKYYSQICKDYPRTFVSSDLPYIRADIELKLKRMLIAYANYNPFIGYAQGMNMICALVLRQFLQHNQFFDSKYLDSFGVSDKDTSASELSATSTVSAASIQSTITSTMTPASISHRNGASSLTTHAQSHSSLVTDSEYDEDVIEEKAFWCFAAVMDNIETLFQHKLIGYHQCVHRLMTVLKSEDNELFSFFEALDIDTMFTGVFLKWFTSLWAYPSFDLRITQQLWDIWLVHDVSNFAVFIKFALLLFQQHRRSLMAMDDIDIPRFCVSQQFIMNDKNWRHRLSALKIKPLYLGRNAYALQGTPYALQDDTNLFRIISLHIAQTRADPEKNFGEYQVCVQCEDRQQWMIWKRFSDFYQLYKTLNAYGIIPANNVVFPAKSYWYRSNDESLMKQRKTDLNEYLKSLLGACHQISKEKISSDTLQLNMLHEFVQCQPSI